MVLGFKLRSPLAREERQGPPKTAYEKIGDHVSTNRAFEDRHDACTLLWLLINNTSKPLSHRTIFAKMLFDSYIVPYVDANEDDELSEKFGAMIVLFAWWDRHLPAIRRINSRDKGTPLLDFELKVLKNLRRVYSLAWPGDLAISQTTLVYMDMAKGIPGMGDGSGGLSDNLAALFEKAATEGE